MKKMYQKPVVIAKVIRAASDGTCGRTPGVCGKLVTHHN